MSKRVELLAPAGNLEKAKIALMYGADAVYVGGKIFSLRARASNFSKEDLKELCEFARSLNKKVYVTCNIIPHDEDFKLLDEYLVYLNEIGVNAIITSSISVMNKAKTLAPKVEVHVSTQTSITNSLAIDFYESIGATRAVLAREVSIFEIEKIKKNTFLELEVFIHGGMCASYSGRCTLSNYMTSRDANRGGCAHSCRWNYNLIMGKKQINLPNEYFNMGSKDLMAIEYIPKLIELGVESLKIEGRMKSVYYIATVVRSYRMLIDDYYENGLKKCFESIAGKDNLKIGLLLGGNWSGPKTYLGDNCKEIVKNKVIAIFNEVTTFEDYCKLFETDKTAIVALDNLEEFLKNGDYKNYDNIKVTGIINQEMFNRFASINIVTDNYVRPDYSPTVIKGVDVISVNDFFQSGLVIPPDCKRLEVSISWVGDCNLHFFGLREDYDRILVDLQTDSSGGDGIVYDKYHNVLEDWFYN